MDAEKDGLDAYNGFGGELAGSRIGRGGVQNLNDVRKSGSFSDIE